MEQKWTIDTPDGYKIYGIKNSPETPSQKAIFIVHGLTSSMHDYALKRAADYFSLNYDVYRFNLYDGCDGARSLDDCTLDTHAADLLSVIEKFSSLYRQSFLIGHSYGGPTIMLANPENITAVSLWDPSFDLVKIRADFQSCFTKMPGSEEFFLVKWGVTNVVNTRMLDREKAFDESGCLALSKKFSSPIQVITAGDGYFANKPISYHSLGHPDNNREIVQGTEHCFVEENTCNELLEKTEKWFTKYAPKTP